MTIFQKKRDRNPEIDPSSSSYTQWTVTDSTHLLATLVGPDGTGLQRHIAQLLSGAPLTKCCTPKPGGH